MEPCIASEHERHPMSDAFHRYCQWYRLEVDDRGFVDIKKKGVEEDLVAHKISFEASAYLSLSVKQLYEVFGAKFLLLLRRPDKMVNSYIQKGWYQGHLVRSDYSLPAGYQPDNLAAHHSFSRIAPIGAEAVKWEELSQVGKLAWYWKAINQRILALFQDLPKKKFKVLRIEDLSYDKYLSIANFIGFSPSPTRNQFNRISDRRPGTLYPINTVHDWNDAERNEFESEVGELAEILGYEWRVKELCKLPKRTRTKRKPKFYRSFRSKIRQIERILMHSIDFHGHK
jgi:hypothetical protein